VVDAGSVTRAGDTVTVAPLLDGGTQLVHLMWWPDAEEAVAMGFGGLDPDEVADRRDKRLAARAAMTDEEALQEEAERKRANAARALRRAKGRVRRYVVANGLTRMLTLTYRPTPVGAPSAGVGVFQDATLMHRSGGDGRCVVCGRPFGPEGMRAAMVDAAAFARRLRRFLGVASVPYVVVPEEHKDGHVHLHVAVKVAIEQEDLEALWGHGFVQAGRKVRAAGGARAAARKAGWYLVKYLLKAFQEGAPERHRYEVGQGWQPAVVKRSGFRTPEEALTFVTDHGRELLYLVRSDDLDGYSGAPFMWASCGAHDPP
jgi:hypothetical protein